MPLPLGLIVEEEKRLIFPDRPTHCAAELVQIELFPAGGEITAGIEISVTEELEQRSVDLIGSGFRGYQHRRTRAGTILSGVSEGENLEFLNRVDRGQDRDSTSGKLVVVIAVEQPVGAAGAGAAHRKRIRSAG